jgi:uncharacterized protein (DUF849 family)
MNDLIINFAPTGIVPTRDMTPHVPITPAEITEQVHEAYETGITMVHVHARRSDGSTEFRSSVYSKIIEGIRKHCPYLVIVVSLSGRRYREFEKRSEVLELKPDMASLTLSSMNFTTEVNMNSPEMIMRLVQKMNEMGVNPEMECFDNGMINYSKYLITKGLIEPPFYYNLFTGGLFTSQADMGQIAGLVQALPDKSLWSLAGLGQEQLKANALAIATGGGVRVGLEDNIWYDQKRIRLATNKELIVRIHRLAEIFERKIMSPKSFGDLGFYNSSRPVI